MDSIYINNYNTLEVWNVAHQCVVEIYKITRDFPSHEKFGLTSQIRRAACSIPANIAEGNGRQHLRDYINFLYISNSSLNELDYFLILAKELEYISEEKCNELRETLKQIGMMLMALIRALKNKLATQSSRV